LASYLGIAERNVMKEKTRLLMCIWVAWGAGVVALSFRSAEGATCLGIFGAMILTFLSLRVLNIDIDPD